MSESVTAYHDPDSKDVPVIYSVAQYDELRYYKTGKNNIDNILDALRSDKSFIELSMIGERISEAEFAEIQQRDKAVSFDIDLDPGNRKIGIFIEQEYGNISSKISFDKSNVESAVSKVNNILRMAGYEKEEKSMDERLDKNLHEVTGEPDFRALRDPDFKATDDLLREITGTRIIDKSEKNKLFTHDDVY